VRKKGGKREKGNPLFPPPLISVCGGRKLEKGKKEERGRRGEKEKRGGVE